MADLGSCRPRCLSCAWLAQAPHGLIMCMLSPCTTRYCCTWSYRGRMVIYAWRRMGHMLMSPCMRRMVC